MAGQVSPGIVLRERDLTNAVAVPAQANTAAFVGSFEKGPVGVITTISSESELISTFGKPNDSNYEDCLLYTSPSPRDKRQSRMPSSA